MTDAFVLICSSCKVRNRIPAEMKGEKANCAKCKTPLDTRGFYTETPIVATDADFRETVENAPLPVFLDCWAPWCGPCKAIGPILDGLARDLAGRVRIVKLNVDENPRIASRFQIRSIPTMMVVYKGKVARTLVGAQSKTAILSALSPYMQD